MAEIRPRPTEAQFIAAQEAFCPGKFGFEEHGAGWKKEFPGTGATIAIAPLTAAHGQLAIPVGNDRFMNPLEYIDTRMRETWDISVPPKILGDVADTGGSVLFAYDVKGGFNTGGPLGFLYGLGSSNGTLVSSFLFVDPALRRNYDVGWHLKVIQMYEALKTGHHSMKWWFDGIRGPNARVNLEKLGGRVYEYLPDKYGQFGHEDTSPRLTVEVDLMDPATQNRIRDLYSGAYKPLTPQDVDDVPIITNDNAVDVLSSAPESVRFEIPEDYEKLNHDAEAGVRLDMQFVFHRLLNVTSTDLGSGYRDPATVSLTTRNGPYFINGFATGPTEDSPRRSFYVFQRK